MSHVPTLYDTFVKLAELIVIMVCLFALFGHLED